MKRSGNFLFSPRILEARRKLTGVQGILAEVLQPQRLRQQNFVRDSEIDRALSPNVTIGETSQVLIRSGSEAINPRDDRSGVRCHRLPFCDGSYKRCCPLQKFDSRLMPTRQM